jgi:hypothetical protein
MIFLGNHKDLAKVLRLLVHRYFLEICKKPYAGMDFPVDIAQIISVTSISVWNSCTHSTSEWKLPAISVGGSLEVVDASLPERNTGFCCNLARGLSSCVTLFIII